MILQEVLLVSPETPRVLMLDRFPDEDPELLAQGYAQTFPDVIYFLVDLAITAEKPEDWPEIKWINWYGKVIADNLYAWYDIGENGLTEKTRLTEDEIKWFLNTNSNSILFVYDGA